MSVSTTSISTAMAAAATAIPQATGGALGRSIKVTSRSRRAVSDVIGTSDCSNYR
ncbi:MAG: hypothetical protein ABWY21_08570 [Rhodococcus sp. (in: high G+C Gram-positive bacteria)]